MDRVSKSFNPSAPSNEGIYLISPPRPFLHAIRYLSQWLMLSNVLLSDIGRIGVDVFNVETIELRNGLQCRGPWIPLREKSDALFNRSRQGKQRGGGYVTRKDLAERHDGL